MSIAITITIIIIITINTNNNRNDCINKPFNSICFKDPSKIHQEISIDSLR